jgi:hypothetical protein
MYTKNVIAIIFGLIVFVLGVIPLLNFFKITSFGSGIVGFYSVLLSWILAIVGIYLIVDSFMEEYFWKWVTGIIGFVIMTIGVLKSLSMIGIQLVSLSFIPPVGYYALLTIEGILLFIAGLAMRRY